MLQFRPSGPFYVEDEIGWVLRNGQPHICVAREVQLGDMLPNCDVRDEADASIRILIPVTRILQAPPRF